MRSLQEKIWRKFKAFGENGILDIHATKSSIDGIKLIENDDKIIPYVTRSVANNGIAQFVSEKNFDFGVDKAGAITIGLDTQTTFYQPHDFVTGQNIQVVTGNSLNENTAQFYSTVLKNQIQAKFNWGGNGATLGRLKRLDILLPVTEVGEPDYEYMAEYARQKREDLLARYRKYVVDRLSELGAPVIISSLKEKEWKSFHLTDIFSEIARGKRLKSADHLDGSMPYVSSSGENNGVAGFISNERGVRIFSDCISFANSGSVGSAFYEPFHFVASDHITHLKNNNFNKNIYLFLALLLSKIGGKYSFNREINDYRISREKIILPINDVGNPDYEYMEQYVKNLMIKKYRQYLEYLRISGDRGSVAEGTDENQYDRYVRAAAPRNGKE